MEIIFLVWLLTTTLSTPEQQQYSSCEEALLKVHKRRPYLNIDVKCD